MKLTETNFRDNRSYTAPKIYPSEETKEILKLASEINLIEQQTEYLRNNDVEVVNLAPNFYKRINII